MKTLKQLAETNFPIYTGYEGLKDIFGDDSNPIMKKLKKQVEILKRKDFLDPVHKAVTKGLAADIFRRSGTDLFAGKR